MNEIEQEFINRRVNFEFPEEPHFKAANVEDVKKKLTEFNHFLSDVSVDIQKVVDLHDELYNELLKLSEVAVLRESFYLFSNVEGCLFKELRVATFAFRNSLDSRFEQFQG